MRTSHKQSWGQFKHAHEEIQMSSPSPVRQEGERGGGPRVRTRHVHVHMIRVHRVPKHHSVYPEGWHHYDSKAAMGT